MTRARRAEEDEMVWKVPFRDCYTDTFRDWVKYTIWCHAVLPIYASWIYEHRSAE